MDTIIEIAAGDGLTVGEPPPESAAPIETTTGRLPHAVLVAAGSGRPIDLRAVGRPAVLVCHGQSTAATARLVNEAVRRDYGPNGVLVASVVNLRSIPKMLRKVAERSMEKASSVSASFLADGLAPDEYVVILPDWDGSIIAALGASDVDTEAVTFVVDADGAVVNEIPGDDTGRLMSSLGSIVG